MEPNSTATEDDITNSLDTMSLPDIARNALKRMGLSKQEEAFLDKLREELTIPVTNTLTAVTTLLTEGSKPFWGSGDELTSHSDELLGLYMTYSSEYKTLHQILSIDNNKRDKELRLITDLHERHTSSDTQEMSVRERLILKRLGDLPRLSYECRESGKKLERERKQSTPGTSGWPLLGVRLTALKAEGRQSETHRGD